MTTSTVSPTLAQAVSAALSYLNSCASYNTNAQNQAAAALISAANAATSATNAAGSVTTVQAAIASINSALGQVLANTQLTVTAANSIGTSATVASTNAVNSQTSAAAAASSATSASGSAASASTSATNAASSATSASASAAAVAATAATLVSLQGSWNASTNSPALASGVGTKGYFYIVSTAGTTTLDGISSWNASDWALFDGTVWRKIDGLTLEVTSVAGRTGAVTIASTDLTDSTSAGRTLLTAASNSAQKTALAIAVADVSGAAPLASPALTGTPTAPTAAGGTNTTQLATTAFVAGSYAPLASPALTGTPTAPTASLGTSTTQVSTTAFVIGQAATAAPLMNSAAAVGTSTTYARADHVHASDTTLMPKAGGAFTGIVSWATAATVASAATVDLGAQTSNTVIISGTTTITSFGSTAPAGGWAWIEFSGVLTLTYNATSLILPTQNSIITAAGDTCLAVCSGSGNWNVYFYQRVSGAALTGAAGGDTVDGTYFGDGVDGSVTISSGTTTLTRNMYYTNLTLSGTGQIVTNGYAVYVSGILDISSAPANAITPYGPASFNGANATSVTSGGVTGTSSTAQNGPWYAQNGAGYPGASGGLSTSAAGTAPSQNGYGGSGGNGGKGGTGASGSGSVAASPTFTQLIAMHLIAPAVHFEIISALIAAAALFIGGGGGGGSSGNGDGSNRGGAGGAGGNGGLAMGVYARTINRGASTAAGAIAAAGGKGGNGWTPTVGNTGGGGGGAGGGGGFIEIVFRFLTGASATNAVSASGGVGGTGGNGVGTGTGGNGGKGGTGGFVNWMNIGAGTTGLVSGSSGSTSSTTTGGVAGAAYLTL